MPDLIEYFIPKNSHLFFTKRDDVQSWADENDIWIGIIPGKILFQTENDLLMFLLRWS